MIARALDAGCLPISALVEEKQIEEAKEVLERCGQIPVFTGTFSLLSNLTGFPLTRGMLYAMRRPPLPSIEEISRGAKRIAVLEEVVNPTNVVPFFVLQQRFIWMSASYQRLQ